MEQAPLIDVEPEDGGKSRMAGCAGCLSRGLPIGVGLLFLVVLLMAGALFIWGGDLRDKEGEEGVAGTESVEPEKKGFAGLVDKVKRVVKGEKDPAEVAGEAGAEEAASSDGMAGAVDKSAALAEAVGAEGKTPEERNQPMKEKFGHLEENRPEGGSGEKVDLAEAAGEGAESGQAGQEGGQIRERRGGSFGSSTGASVTTGANNQYRRWRGNFSTSGSDLEFEVIYQEVGGQLQFRCFILPYDSQTARLFRAGKGDFMLSFHDDKAQRLVPADGDLSIDTTNLTAFESQGKVVGWVSRGTVPLNGKNIPDLKSVRLGWDFDSELSDWLKDLKKTRGQ